ncbi:endolytic transglycosylase MltG [Beijerinckia sp. L45]|uniref:endolytic transglycosylase MltG n=1 Tax=Beijerinckia sp. L45 TaxID=1641855 RepID=UPI00131E3066|nr:endolytic transglycosylase MltG [Beijerinckia sp. L45]
MTPQSPNEALQPEAAPPPPPMLPPSRKRRRLSALSGLFSFVLIIALGAMLAVVWGEHRLREPGPLTADKVVFILKGSTGDIVDKLADEGVIESPLTVQIALMVKNLQGDKERLKAGEYLFKRQATIDDVIATLVSGKQILHTITIPEGLTSQQVVQRLHDADVLVGDMRDPPKEGSILPETYKVARGSTRAELLSKMKDDQRKAVDQIWARRSPDLPLRSPYEMVTLASIVEKETGKADERSRVAGVFINRLRKHMRLQSDPTIVYGLVGGQGTLGHSISHDELLKPTAYNTYTIDGLPPGPIDNPGRAALEAVANPSRTGDLYFVADGTGGHAFADTIEQHNKNVIRWRQLEHDAKEKGAGDVDKVVPASIPGATPRPNQRSDASDSVFGDLGSFDQAAPKPHVASFMDPTQSHGMEIAPIADAVAPTAVEAPAATIKRSGARTKVASAAIGSFAVSPGIDALGISIKGAEPSAAGVLDGPVSSVSDDAAPSSPGDKFATGPTPEQMAAAAGRKPPEHPKIFDVSEGTALDPLRDKSYDLNSAKTVPDFSKPGP